MLKSMIPLALHVIADSGIPPGEVPETRARQRHWKARRKTQVPQGLILGLTSGDAAHRKAADNLAPSPVL